MVQWYRTVFCNSHCLGFFVSDYVITALYKYRILSS